MSYLSFLKKYGISSFFRNHRGFSLIEISVVIAIIGLIVAGAATGSSLIEKARLQSIPREFEQLQTAIRTFGQTYDALPGNLANASLFFDATGDGSSCDNGDGDGSINPVVAVANQGESFCAWYHLRTFLSGNLQGNYLGKVAIGGIPVLGEDIPQSKFRGAGYLITSFSDVNHFVFTSPVANAASAADVVGALTPKQAYSLTKKIGPATGGQGGNLIAINAANAAGPATATATDCHSATEFDNMSSEDALCALAQEIDF